MSESMRPTRVLHVISGLETGGAERVMARVVYGLGSLGVLSSVVSVRGGGAIADELRGRRVAVTELGIRGPLNAASGIRRLRAAVGDFQPDIIQGWMYHGNLFAWLAARGRIPFVFGIRHSLPRLSDEKWMTQCVIRLGARLSRKAAAVVYNAKCSQQHHEAIGYGRDRGVWIPNGFDTTVYRPLVERRDSLRQAVGLTSKDFAFGLVARYHPVKGHRLFLQAARIVARALPDARFVLAGRGVGDVGSGLLAEAERLGISARVIFLEERKDVVALMNALDVACLASRGEGFPNVVGEAMACGIPVVATDVGDVVALVGDAGKVVPPEDAQALAAAMLALAALPDSQRRALAVAGRRRIETVFSEDRMIASFADLYAAHAGARRGT
jgi:glycosyltransferase involved in cell wall biosynthesis